MRIVFQATCLFTLLGCLGIHQAYGDEDPLFRIIKLESNAGLEVGRGLDILTGSPRSDCVERSIVEAHPNFGPNSVTFRSIRIENSEQIDKALGLSASGSVNAGFGSGGASAAVSNTLSISNYTLNYLVETVVSAKGNSIRDVKLKPQFSALIANGNPLAIERFRTICGDGYVGEFTMGGEYQALIQIHTKSKADSESVAASLSASFSMATGAASFSNSLKKVVETHEVRIWSLQRGGSGATPITAEDIATKASTLPDNVKQAAIPNQAAVFSYILLLEDPTLPLTDFVQRETALSYLVGLSRRVRDQQANAQYIYDHPSEFYSSPTDIPKLAAEINALINYRKVINARAAECARAGGICESIDMAIPSPTTRPARR